jgi:hypothetical protein
MRKQFDECMLERDQKKRKNDYWRAFPMGKAKAGLEAQKAEQGRACPMEKPRQPNALHLKN